ncbi:hypothetical protein Daudx_0805 [Candidatus Desulforudis audaxviator]|nr:hypothetical protein Daudx_0805 [Candidatus Desulforudis audaxviator]
MVTVFSVSRQLQQLLYCRRTLDHAACPNRPVAGADRI